MSFFEPRISEPKPNKDNTLVVRTVKAGNKLLGTIEAARTKPGEKPAPGIYWASNEVIRPAALGSAFSVTRAAVNGLKTYGVGFLGARFPDGSSYVLPLSVLADPEKVILDRAKPYLLVAKGLWEETLPPEEMRVANTLEKMRVAGGRRKSSMTAV